MRIEKKVAKLLTNQRKTLSIAESCTGGLLCHRLTNIAGSSNFFKIGLVVYSNDAKMKFLKIPSTVLIEHGAVSCEVARRMAQEIRKKLQTDFGIGITGIAGPGGATARKPIGLTFIAISKKNETISKQFIFKGNRSTIKSQAATWALRMLLSFLQSSEEKVQSRK